MGRRIVLVGMGYILWTALALWCGLALFGVDHSLHGQIAGAVWGGIWGMAYMGWAAAWLIWRSRSPTL